MSAHAVRRLLPALCLALSIGAAHAAPVTIIGSNVDVTYDDTLLGRYSAPTLAGDTLVFTTNRLFAESLNGQGLATLADAVSGIVISAKGGFRLGGAELAAFGDYRLSGTGSSVQVSGLLSLLDPAAGGAVLDSGSLQVSAATPLNLADGANRDWTAGARAGGGGSYGSLGLRIDTTLEAFTGGGAGLRQAFIEQKFSGLQLRLVNASTVSLPSSLSLVALALVAAGLLRRR
jgi:hypothetical protein